MPGLSITATTTTQVTIKPALKRKLMTELVAYAQLAGKRKAIDEQMEKHSTAVEAIQVELGESKLEVDGYKATLVAPVRKVLDKQRFVALGGRLDLLDKATLDTPSKAYVKITAPGAKEEGD